MVCGDTAMERAMKLQEVILRALSGEFTWIGGGARDIKPANSSRSTTGVSGRRPAKLPLLSSSASCGCIARPIVASTCATSISSSAATTASPSPNSWTPYPASSGW
jgi:hypothetical protein